jgi:glycosyltransferase involved in cell wall biosynthesis
MADVSAVITSHNYAQYLSAAIDSVLGQTSSALEVIVVDDGSSDDTERVVEPYRAKVRYVRQPNQGVAVARNRGIAESEGRYVAFLDADDLWLPRKLELQIDALSRQPDYRACASAHRSFGPELSPPPVAREKQQRSLLEALVVSGNVVGIPSTMLCERSLLAEVGGFDPELGDCADWDAWIRIAGVAGVARVNEPLVAYRLHDRNMTHNVALRERDSVRVLEKAFAMKSLPAEVRARRRRVFARNYMVLGGSYLHAGSYRNFVRCVARAIALDVRQAGYPVAWPVRLLARASAGRREKDVA